MLLLHKPGFALLDVSLGPYDIPPVPHPYLFPPLLSPSEYSEHGKHKQTGSGISKALIAEKENSEAHVLLEVSVVTSATDSQTTLNTHKIIYLSD